MAYTLAQFAKLETDATKKYVMTNLLREMKIAEYLPFTSVNSLRMSAIRWRQLPDVGFRDLNAGYTEDSSGDVEEVWESLSILGGEVNFDRVFGMVSNTITDPNKLQLDMKLMSIALTFNNYFINGDWASDPLGFEGLKKRVASMPSRQTVHCGVSDAALDVTASAASTAKFWNKIAESYQYCNRGQVNLMVCREDLLIGISKSLRYINSAGGNFLDVTKDNFDRSVLNYLGTPIVDIGLKKDQSTEIILAAEAEYGGSAHTIATSLYFVSLNEQQGVTGVQLRPMEVIPYAEKDVATVDKTLLEWVVGLAGFGSYGIVRLDSILAPGSWTA
jgi:hypothetical protein